MTADMQARLPKAFAEAAVEVDGYSTQAPRTAMKPIPILVFAVAIVPVTREK